MFTTLIAMALTTSPTSPLSLGGPWQFALDPHKVGEREAWFERPLGDTIHLPTTTDEARKGTLNPPGQNTGGLTRRYPYVGWAWYARSLEIPASFAEKNLLLTLERTKATTLWLDGKPVGSDRTLSAPQEFNLGRVAPGKHQLVIRVDNSLRNWPDRVSASHMLEESTQTNWNGILGEISLRAIDDVWIRGVTVNREGGRLKLTVRTEGETKGGIFSAILIDTHGVHHTATSRSPKLEIVAPVELWDEYERPLVDLAVSYRSATANADWVRPVGARSFVAEGGHFKINGRRTFLRGKHDACVFPLTGYPPMTPEGWDRYLRICQSYGLNHIRFHSWCPPEAAFIAADRLGVYLQPELPFWGDASRPGVEKFLTAEGKRILEAYGHHPSFVALSLGNEYWGGPAQRTRMVAALRKYDSTRLYDQGSNTESWNPHEMPGDDYRVQVQSIKGVEGEMRGSVGETKGVTPAYIQRGVPGTSHTYSEGLQEKSIPFVSHEVGQYEVYPRFREAAKYKGVLRADNFEFFREDLAKHGMAGLGDAFARASGMLAMQCYREEIEATLRTPEFDGFQLLDLQDYPGQGTALVGMLDAFMNSKGLIKPAEWRAFCSDLVPLALFPKYTWTSDEALSVEMRVANYTTAAVSGPLRYELRQGSQVLSKGQLKVSIQTGGTTTVGHVGIHLGGVKVPGTADLKLTFASRSLSWRIWVYGKASVETPPNVVVARDLDASLWKALEEGKRVVLFPNAIRQDLAMKGYYTPDFWCFQMFHGMGSTQPGTDGYLIHNQHPALADFPSESYSTWQWQSLAHASTAVVLDAWPKVDEIVQPIDNYNRNHRLGTIFEAKVGRGSLLVCTIRLPDLDTPEARQLYVSLLRYAGSSKFQPRVEIPRSVIEETFGVIHDSLPHAL